MQKKALYVMLTLAWSAAFYVVFSGFTSSADFKIGYIMTDKLFIEYQPAVDVQKKIEVEQQNLEKQAITMQEELDKKVKEYDSQRLMLSDTKKAEIENELRNLDVKIYEFQQENFDPNTGTLAQKWQELMQPVVEDVQAVIDRTGVEEGYDVIFEVREGTSFMLYAKEEYDLTDHILEELKKK